MSEFIGLLFDPVVLAVFAALGVLLVFYAFYLSNLERERDHLQPQTFVGFLRGVFAGVVNVLDEWAPVFKTRTGAHATLSQALSWVGLTVAAPRMELYVTFLLGAALVYCWLRTMHGRKNATVSLVKPDTGLMPHGAALELAASQTAPDPDLKTDYSAFLAARNAAMDCVQGESTPPKPKGRSSRPSRSARKKPARSTTRRPAKKAKAKAKRARR